MMLRLLRRALKGEPGLASLVSKVQSMFSDIGQSDIMLETCYYINISHPLTLEEEEKL
jgi:hypothetical protein